MFTVALLVMVVHCLSGWCLFQIYQSWLDRSTPFSIGRWGVTLSLTAIYMIRVYILQVEPHTTLRAYPEPHSGECNIPNTPHRNAMSRADIIPSSTCQKGTSVLHNIFLSERSTTLYPTEYAPDVLKGGLGNVTLHHTQWDNFLLTGINSQSKICQDVGMPQAREHVWKSL